MTLFTGSFFMHILSVIISLKGLANVFLFILMSKPYSPSLSLNVLLSPLIISSGFAVQVVDFSIQN